MLLKTKACQEKRPGFAKISRTPKTIDRACFGGDTTQRASLAASMMREDPAAFREMVLDSLRALEEAAQALPARGDAPRAVQVTPPSPNSHDNDSGSPRLTSKHPPRHPGVRFRAIAHSASKSDKYWPRQPHDFATRRRNGELRASGGSATRSLGVRFAHAGSDATRNVLRAFRSISIASKTKIRLPLRQRRANLGLVARAK